jgi:hypothetical protein
MTLSEMVTEQFDPKARLTPAELRYLLRWHPADGSAGFLDKQTKVWAYRFQICAKIQNMLRAQDHET